MEERISFFLLGQETGRPLSSIFNMEPLLEEAHLKQIRLPLQLKKFKVNLQVLNACLYFVIAIQKNIVGEGSAQFRQRCLAAISNYYIKRKMNFELYEFGYLCSRILSLPIEKVIHVIYFMVYARLASKPYITNLISQSRGRPRHSRKHTLRSEYNRSHHTRSNDSRHFTVFMENHTTDLDIFRKDLKKILNSQGQLKKASNKVENKRYFNLRKVYPDQQQNFSCQGSKEENPFSPQSNRKGITIPLKVGAMDNSSVMARLKYTTSMTEDRETPFKKLQMRRQKFNEDFDCAKKYELLGKEEEKQYRKYSNGAFRSVNGEDSGKSALHVFRIQKHPFEYFTKMASRIKTENKDLDNIRSNCTSNAFRKLTYKDQQWNRKQSQLKSCQTSPLYNQSMINLKFPAYNTHQKQNNADSAALSLSKVSGKKVDENISIESSPVSEQVPANLVTRKTNQMNLEEQKLMLFNKKLKHKFKVQKYKEEYRQFLKTQMFEKANNIVY